MRSIIKTNCNVHFDARARKPFQRLLGVCGVSIDDDETINENKMQIIEYWDTIYSETDVHNKYTSKRYGSQALTKFYIRLA